MLFDLRKRLGAGHFGEVWLATDLGLNVDRAVKLIPPNKVPDKANFFREAQILKEAEHPNIVRVEAAGQYGDGRIYVAMELLPRGSVEDEASGGFLPLTRAKKIMVDVLRGLEWAHSKGIIHHDIKPGNILIGDANQGKLSDFGLALRVADPKSIAVKDYNYLLHIAPETYKKGEHSAQSDLYACGVTLYRMVNGDSVLPVVAPQDAAALACRGEYPDRSRYRWFIPRALRLIINKAISVDPRDRYSSAEAMRRALEQLDVHMNWSERSGSDFVRWTSAWDGRCYEVVLHKRQGDRYDVSVSKGASKQSLRRMKRFCGLGLAKPKAEQLAKKVLQDLVSGRVA